MFCLLYVDQSWILNHGRLNFVFCLHTTEGHYTVSLTLSYETFVYVLLGTVTLLSLTSIQRTDAEHPGGSQSPSTVWGAHTSRTWDHAASWLVQLCKFVSWLPTPGVQPPLPPLNFSSLRLPHFFRIIFTVYPAQNSDWLPPTPANLKQNWQGCAAQVFATIPLATETEV